MCVLSIEPSFVVSGSQTLGTCRATTDCSVGDEVGTMSIEQCCLNTAFGLAFTASESESCIVCIGVSPYR